MSDVFADRRAPRRLSSARVPRDLVDPRLAADAATSETIDVDVDLDAAGRIADVRRAVGGASSDGVVQDGVALGGRMLWPLLVEPHAHIDKAHTVVRAPNEKAGTSDGARAAAKVDRARFTDADVARRMEFALRTAEAHGVGAIRTHIDSQKGRTEPAWTVFRRLQAAWAGRIDLQGVATLGAKKLDGDYGEEIARRCADADAALGPVVYAEKHGDAHLDRAFELAERFGLDLDFHVDETLDPTATGLRSIARRVRDRGFRGRVLCGHGCSLAALSEADAQETMRLMAEAGVALVASPATNLLLQDRTAGRAPRLRGMAPIQELAAAGVTVAVGSDNCRDAFHAFGDHDPIDAFRDAVRVGHLDTDLGRWAGLIGPQAREAIGLAPRRIAPGAPADFVLFAARSFSELLARPHAPRRVFRAGRQVHVAVPPYTSLDGDDAVR